MYKKLIIASALAVFATITACNNSKTEEGKTSSADTTKTSVATQNFNLDTTKLASGEAFYQCEMNPEVLSDKAGSCPKCGMELSEMKKN